MQLIFFSLYLQGIFTVPSCLIMEPPYAESMASFFSKASGCFVYLFQPQYIKEKYIILYNVHRIKGKKWREGP